MKRMFGLAGLASVAMLTGCVPVEKYNALKLEARGYEEGMHSAQAEAAAQRAQYEALQARLGAADATSSDMVSALKLANDRYDAKQAELDALNAKYQEAIRRAGTVGSLPVPLTNELKAFAAQNPGLVEFDEGRGIVKFTSDVTFDLGDATLKPQAREALQRFAAILTSPAAANYELLVAGHTDKTPVSNPETIRKGHKNNWYLSAHRAISVADELMAQKVSPARLGVVGYADQRPISSNAAANRRVEVLILPTQVRSGPTEATSAPAAASRTPAPNNNKDAGTTTPPPAPVNDNK